ncbi:MAG: group II intron maturase-specific domain-containing protein [Clostridia bacterium]
MVKDPYQDFIKRFERKLKQLTKRSWSVTMDERIKRLNQVIRGWNNYFRMGSMKENLKRIDGPLRNRMRIVIWKQWKTGKTRSTSMDGETLCGICRSLSSGYKERRIAFHKQRSPRKTRTSKPFYYLN